MSNTEPVVHEIAGRKYYIFPFPAMKAMYMSGELAGLLGPVLGLLADLVVGGDDDSDDIDFGKIDVNEIAGAIMRTGINGEKMEKLTKLLLLDQNIGIKTEEGTQFLDEDLMDECFSGHIQNAFILMFYVISVNFGNFFGGSETPSGTESGGATANLKKIL